MQIRNKKLAVCPNVQVLVISEWLHISSQLLCVLKCISIYLLFLSGFNEYISSQFHLPVALAPFHKQSEQCMVVDPAVYIQQQLYIQKAHSQHICMHNGIP